jgi:membrane protein DedA with SNARE-associated domain
MIATLTSWLLSTLLSFILLYKYQALFGIAFLAALALPLPASSTLAAAGAFASQGYMNIYTVFVVAFLGNLAADATGYFIARIYGKRLLRKIGFGRLLDGEHYHDLEDYLKHFSSSLIFLSRFLTQVGPTVNILAGLTEVSYRKFFIVDIVGELTYVSVYLLVGYVLGNEWENNIGFLAEAALVIISLGLLVSYIQWKMYRNHKNKRLAR